MKTKLLVHSLILFAPLALLTGCVGFNTALFMTKSNAGLDFDSKPPTAEINISRKEGVVEPTFEGGKTPPVMSSFGSKIGSGGGVGRFFFGVDQTFAGGDAAVTMAKLYDNTNSFPDRSDWEVVSNRAKFDSGLDLSKPPKANSQMGKGWLGWKKRLFGLPEPGEVRPFFFGTDTQLGVKVGWNGVGGPYPDNIKIGFNRKEIAVAPLTLTPREVFDGQPRTNVVRIPSFLATVDSNVEGAGDVGVSWMQYFATGDSAKYLARQYGVRKAMLERADPKAALKADELAGAQQAKSDQKKADEIVAWAKTDDGKLDGNKIDTLLKGTQLPADEVKKMTADQFRQKLARSWSLDIPTLYRNKPKQ